MPGARYPQTLVITGKGVGGAQNRGTGVFTPPAAAVVYNDLADVQDDGEQIPRDSDTRAVRESFARAFLKDRAKIKDVKPEQVASVTFEDGVVRDAEVMSVRLLDWSIQLRWM